MLYYSSRAFWFDAMDGGALAMTDDQAARAEIKSAAMTLLAQYGEDAEIIATLRAAEVAAAGDTEALKHWDGVIAFLENGPDANQLN